MTRTIIIDGSSLIYRAFFALPSLVTADGTPTNAVYGLATMLIRLLQDESPDILVMAMEGGRTFRHEEFAEYKSHRPRTPDELAVQMPLTRELAEAFRIPLIACPGYEADDVIGSLACKAAKQGHDVLIVTGDLDALQLIGPQVKVMVNRRGISDAQVYDTEAVIERFGLRPEQLPDFKALKGDTSDNIPGVPGVGDKTASALIQQWGSLDELVKHLEEVKQARVRENLLKLKDELPLYRRLATVVIDLDLESPWDEWRHPGIDAPRLRSLFHQLEFRTLAGRLPENVERSGPQETAPAAATVRTLLTGVDELARWLEGASGAVAIATQRTGRRGALRAVALASDSEVVELHAGEPDGEGLLAGTGESIPVPAQLLALGCPGHPELAGWDLKNDLQALWNGVEPPGAAEIEPAFDAALAAYLLNPGRASYSLEDLCGQFCVPCSPGLKETPAARASAVLQLREPVEARLKLDQLDHLYQELELPLLVLLARIEACGVRVDREALQSLSSRMRLRIEQIEAEVSDVAGGPVNLGSTKQLQQLLFGDLKLPAGRRTKTGYSTDSDVLLDLAELHPLPALILEYREITRLKSTYADALIGLIDPRDGRVHTSLNQMVAATGRLSSSDPNLQNIPIRTELGRQIRAAFIPEPGRRLISADYSQIELRIMAHMSGDPGLVEAFREGRDVHTATAAEIFGIEDDQVDSAQRRAAKTVNFAVLYGQREYGLSRQLRIDIGEARALIARYFERFPAVRAALDQTLDQARKSGYVTTLPPYRRRRYIPAIHSGNRNERMAAEREAMNAPVQGAASDIMKAAMLRVDRALRKEGAPARIILQVHDELLLEVEPSAEQAVAALVCREMAAAADLQAPLEVSVKSGANWRDVTSAEE